MSNKGKNYDTQSSTTTEAMVTMEDQSEENTGINNNIGETDDVCILQCLFEKLEMVSHNYYYFCIKLIHFLGYLQTDSNGLPDHKKFAAALLKTASGREMRDFLQESTDQCFQQIEQGMYVICLCYGVFFKVAFDNYFSGGVFADDIVIKLTIELSGSVGLADVYLQFIIL